MPVRARDLIRALAAFGVTVSESKGGSSHWIAQRGGSRFPLPLHNGPKTELADVYVRKVCQCFAIDEAALRKLL